MNRIFPFLLLVCAAVAAAQEPSSPAAGAEPAAASAAEPGPKPEPEFARFSVGVEYDFFTVTDFALTLVSILDEDEANTNGAVSVDFGYAFSRHFETGVIVNYAVSSTPLLTLMPKIRLNGALGKWINPFAELDLGVMIAPGEGTAGKMFHLTLLGLELGYPISVRFQIPYLVWGQRGISYVGVGYRF